MRTSSMDKNVLIVLVNKPALLALVRIIVVKVADKAVSRAVISKARICHRATIELK